MIRTLAQFAAACGGRLVGEDCAFTEVVIDTRKLASGELFAALPGQRLDGHQFVGDAAAKGAGGLRRALGRAADIGRACRAGQ